MMLKLVIAHPLCLQAMRSEAEGRYENARDDNQSTAVYEATMDWLESLPEDAVGGFEITAVATKPEVSVVGIARVLSDCVENMQDSYAAAYCFDEPEDEDAFEVNKEACSVEGLRSAPLPCADAIEAAIEAIELAHCVEGLPPRLKRVVDTLQMILAQQGVETWEVGASDGMLTTAMDIAIFG